MARNLADKFPRPPGRGDPRTVAVLRTRTGKPYEARSGFDEEAHPDLQSVLDDVPAGQRPPWHGYCAEVHCINQALKAEGSVKGATVATAKVRGPNSPAHGDPLPPCPSREVVLRKMKVRYQS